MVEISYFTLAAVLLYFISDWILNQIEKSKGERLPNRSFVFFGIILVLSVITFNLIERLLA